MPLSTDIIADQVSTHAEAVGLTVTNNTACHNTGNSL